LLNNLISITKLSVPSPRNIAQQISETIVHIVVQASQLTWRLLRDN